MTTANDQSEYQARRERIGPKLAASGWQIVTFHPATLPSAYSRHAVADYPTANGPADYALCVGGQRLGSRG
jgi:type I restriction enzyme R subunit